MVSVFNNKKCVSLSNRKCMTEPTFINLHPFAINLGRCVGSCNTLNDLPNKVCVPSKTEDLNLWVFNMITGINELKTWRDLNVTKRLYSNTGAFLNNYQVLLKIQ